MAAFEGGEIILYEAALDYHSQCARMLLHEKGVKYTSKAVDEAKLENYEPWYLKLNGKATLPTLVCGGTVIAEPRKIIEWIQELPVGKQPLKPPPESYMLENLAKECVRAASSPQASRCRPSAQWRCGAGPSSGSWAWSPGRRGR